MGNNPFEDMHARFDKIENLIQNLAERQQGDSPKSENFKDEFITREEAAEEMGVCVTTIDNLAKEGRLKKYRNGGRIVRIKKSELIEVLQSFKGGWSRKYDNR